MKTRCRWQDMTIVDLMNGFEYVKWNCLLTIGFIHEVLCIWL
jgi:hypothetical protein